MTREDAIHFANCLKNNYTVDLNDMEAFCDMAIKALEQEPCEDATLKDIFCMGCEYKEQEPILDKIDEIITDALDKSTDQKESQTLRWVLDKISEVT